MFQKFARFYTREKIDFGHKLIIFTFNFAGARGTSCAGNGINEVRCLPQGVAERRFARA